MTCELHEYEKIILAKKFSFGEFGFIWLRCKKCGLKKPSMFPCDMDAKGNLLSSNLEKVKANHPNYKVVWEGVE